MRTIKTIILTITLMLFLPILSRASDDLLAKVQAGETKLVIKNGNDTAWKDAHVILNDTFSGYEFIVAGAWQPGETKTLPLEAFTKILDKTKSFKPEFQKVDEVDIDAGGFSMGIYKVRK